MTVFRSGTVLTLVLVSGASFLLAILVSIYGPDLDPRDSVDPDAYSRSALGHAAMVDALRKAGLAVDVSRRDAVARTGERGILVLAEPTERAEGDPGRLGDLVSEPVSTLLVLPKRRGWPHPERHGWIARTDLLARSRVEALLRGAGIDASVRRLAPASVAPVDSRIGKAPTFLDGEVQTVEGPSLVPLVTTAGGGALFARVETHPGLYILADPDPISNAGFHRDENAAFVLAALQHVHDGFERVVLDERIHGYAYRPSIWREAFDFPLVLVVLHAGLVVLILLWASSGRFGRAARTAEPTQPGRAYLVDRSADLLQAGGRMTQALPRYLAVVLQEVRRGLDLPATLHDDELDLALDRIGASRRVGDRVGDLRRTVTRARGHRLLAYGAAQRIHRWRTEILHGDQ